MIQAKATTANSTRVNLAFYESNADKYAEQTWRADLSHLYPHFLKLLPKGGRILDVGCGAGRDLNAFRECGFRPLGIDPSPSLVRIARLRSGCETVVSSAEKLSFVSEFDGVWACASLLHLPKHTLPLALTRIRQALRMGGVLFLSMQEGAGEGTEDGRFFSRYELAELLGAVRAAGFKTVKVWRTADSLGGRKAVRWINILSRKE